MKRFARRSHCALLATISIACTSTREPKAVAPPIMAAPAIALIEPAPEPIHLERVGSFNHDIWFDDYEVHATGDAVRVQVKPDGDSRFDLSVLAIHDKPNRYPREHGLELSLHFEFDAKSGPRVAASAEWRSDRNYERREVTNLHGDVYWHVTHEGIQLRISLVGDLRGSPIPISAGLELRGPDVDTYGWRLASSSPTTSPR